MALEQQIKSAIEAATARLTGEFQERLQALASELIQEVEARHARELEGAVARATAELMSQHEAALLALRAEAAEQRDLAISMVRTEAAEEQDAAVAAARAEAAVQRDAALDALRAELRTQHETAFDALRSEIGARHEAALDALRAELQGQHEAALSAAAEGARAEAEAERGKALAQLGTELAAQHETALEALRADLATEHAAALAAVRVQLVSDHEADLAARRAELAAQHDAALAAVRAEADERVAQARAEADELLSHARTEADRRLTAAKAEAEAAAAASVAAAEAEAAQASGQVVDARAAERQAEMAFAERLSDALRRLDTARSLIEVLDVLVEAAAREVPRVAIFLVRGGKLAGWRAAGFSREEDPRELEVPLDQAGLLTRAVRSAAAVTTADALSEDGGVTPFGALPVASAALTIPLRVGGETVGVLYADDVSAREHEAPSAWPESVEMLARHACRCLEVVTVTRVTQPMAIPAPSRPTPRRHTPHARTFQVGHDDDDDAARRYARLLVSEIKLYHESAVNAGRRDRNLVERLRTEIDRARRLYAERVPAAVQTRADYFEQELVRTLANGDASLLGPA
jgi:chemotaxis protein histidine kinase CheA